jgi:hypothetical protein
MSGKETYLCNFVRLKVKSIFPLRETQINSNFVACVRDRSGKPAARRGLVTDSPLGRPNKYKNFKNLQLWQEIQSLFIRCIGLTESTEGPLLGFFFHYKVCTYCKELSRTWGMSHQYQG